MELVFGIMDLLSFFPHSLELSCMMLIANHNECSDIWMCIILTDTREETIAWYVQYNRNHVIEVKLCLCPCNTLIHMRYPQPSTFGSSSLILFLSSSTENIEKNVQKTVYM